MDHVLVLGSVADDKDDEAAPLQVEGERLCQGQGGRPGDDDDLGAAAIPGPRGAAGLLQPAAPTIAFVGGGADDDDDDARQDLVAGDPGLQALEARGGGSGGGSGRGSGRRAGADRVRDPGGRGQSLADGVGGTVGGAVDEAGDVVGVAAKVHGDAGELSWRLVVSDCRVTAQGTDIPRLETVGRRQTCLRRPCSSRHGEKGGYSDLMMMRLK